MVPREACAMGYNCQDEDKTVEKSSAYQEMLKRQDKTFKELDKAGLSKE